MDQITTFVANHWTLVTAFIVVLGILLASFVTAAGGVTPQSAVTLINRDRAVAVDLRSAAEYAGGHIIDAVHLPPDALDAAADKLKPHAGRPLLLYCASGTQTGRAVRQLKAQGYADVHALKGGIAAWRADNLPVTAA